MILSNKNNCLRFEANFYNLYVSSNHKNNVEGEFEMDEHIIGLWKVTESKLATVKVAMHV